MFLKNQNAIILTATVNHKYGLHGYDNLLRSMRPFLLAFGPSIRQGHHLPQVHSLDLFSLWTEMLQLQPQQTNGTLNSNTLQMLRHHHITPSLSSLLITCKNCMKIACKRTPIII